MGKIYRIGTRTSPLAIRQVEEVIQALRQFYPEINYEIVGIKTYGDKDKITPISDIEGSDFFTREIEESLLKGYIDPSASSFDKLRTNPERSRTGSLSVNGESFDFAQDASAKDAELAEARSRTIDFAVHSAKDLPDEIPKGLIIAATTKSIDPYDALVSKYNLKLSQLPKGAKIGTSSSRRKEQLRKFRSDLQIVDIRGNIDERLKLLDDNLDSIVIAACGLLRLGLEYRITQRIPFEILKPHPLQGCLAIETRSCDTSLIKLLLPLNNFKE